ncbi:MAG: TPM domain-containing protein [Desulfobulbaceae bacterium]|nr:TPM domain-containing protein [Desulfobulbaceae bacterium]
MRVFAQYIRRWRLGLALLLVTCVLGLGSLALALDVPSYKGYVNDYADMISPQEETKLERALQSFDMTDSTQVAILTIASLEGDSLEGFSIRTVDQWKIGQKGKDNGVLLLIVKNDRKIRIEVGRGLEPVLTDLLSGRIIDTVISPYFKSGKFDQGIEAGCVAIIQATRGEFKADRRGVRRGKEPPPLLFQFLFFGLFLVAFLGRIWRPLGVIGGAVLFPLAFLFGLLPFSFLLLLLLIPAGAFGGWLLPFFMAGMLRGGGMGYYGGGGGGGFGGGGFGGFGGGGFGGGGASGGW